ncbi:MAG: hypothetical protein RJB02_212, partial [Pseudomonadota bacterium]
MRSAPHPKGGILDKTELAVS